MTHKPRRLPPQPARSPEEEEEQARYLREGGDLGIFSEGFPADVGAGIMWTLMKRQSMAAAMWRAHGAEPLIKVRRVPLKGVPRHLHGSDAQHTDDHFTRGVERLGPLGYSLLRGQLLIQQHLMLRAELLRNAYEDLIAGVIGARADLVDQSDWLYRERARLIFWDALGVLHQVSEQVAVLFDARQRWIRGDGDLGELIIRSEVQGWKTIQGSGFASRVSWCRLIGMPANSKAKASLSRDQSTLLQTIQDRTEMLLMADVNLLRAVWSRDLHRAATRYKHSYPIISASHGVVWFGEDESTQADIRRLVKGGALVVADASQDGTIEELVIPVTIGGIEHLFGAIVAALHVAAVLVDATLQAAEHVSRRVLVVHPVLYRTGAVRMHDVMSLMAAYTASPDLLDVEADTAAQEESRRSIEAAARRLRGHIASGYWRPFDPAVSEEPGTDNSDAKP